MCNYLHLPFGIFSGLRSQSTWNDTNTDGRRVTESIGDNKIERNAYEAFSLPFSAFRACQYIYTRFGISGFHTGIRTTILCALLPEPFFYLVSVSFLVKSRRMLEGVIDGNPHGRVVSILRDILKEDGVLGFFAGTKALLVGAAPTLATFMLTRFGISYFFGSNKAKQARDRKRYYHVKTLMLKFSERQKERSNQECE